MTNFISEVKELSFLTLYGSQMGQAQSIAESILDSSSEHYLTTKVYSLNEVKDIEDLAKLECPIVIVTSTTGDGEPPENADRFWRKIRRKVLKPLTLKSVKYTLLGLGDTNFNNFCNCGKQLNKRFQELGATSIYPAAWADDAVGQDTIIEDWLEGLWPVLKTFGSKTECGELSISNSNNTIEINMGDSTETVKLTLPPCPPMSLIMSYPAADNQSPIFDLLNPPVAYPLNDDYARKGSMTGARCLTKENAIKTTLEVTIEFSEDPFEFEPGDAVNFICSNPTDEVNCLLNRLNILDDADKPFSIDLLPNITKGKVPVHIPKLTTLRHCFLYYLDIRTPPKKAFIRLLAEFTSDEAEKCKLWELCSRQGSKIFEESIRAPTISLLDLLLLYPSCFPKPEVLLEHLPRLIPRAYSVSSSPLSRENSFTVAFNIIHFSQEDGRQYSRLGVCTGWLLERAKRFIDVSIDIPSINPKSDLNVEEAMQKLQLRSDDVPIIFYKRKNHSFRLPVDMKAPVVMVGPGTGVAPFIGFLEHRSKQRSSQEIGKMVLFFGCRHKNRDFLYEDFLNGLVKDGTLTSLNVSLSRDENELGIKYVQDFMVKNKENLVSWLLDEKGYFYVCGDAKNMAKNVREKLIWCIQDVKQITEKEAMEEVKNLVTNKRYLQDVWG